MGTKNWLLNKSRVDYGAHSPFSLSVLTKENVCLAKLCVYFNSTPVLDQLLAMSFFVESGAEEQILEEANVFGYDLAILKAHAGQSPALASKVEMLEERKKSREENPQQHARQLMLQDPEMLAHAWRSNQYKQQTEQWALGWLEDTARGTKACADVSREAEALVEELLGGKGVTLSSVFAYAGNEQLTTQDVKQICSKQY